MTLPEIVEKLKSNYEKEKSRVFVLHLVRAYYPGYEKVKEDQKGLLKCTLSGQLLTIDNAYQGSMTDTILSLTGIEAVRAFADELKATDEFVKRACTINKTGNVNKYKPYDSHGRK